MFLENIGNDEGETGRPNRSIAGFEPGVSGRILAFLIMGQFAQQQACCQHMGYTCLKGVKELCTGVNRAH